MVEGKFLCDSKGTEHALFDLCYWERGSVGERVENFECFLIGLKSEFSS